MRLPRNVLNAYNRAIKQCGDKAEVATRKALYAWLEGHPGASVEQVREVSIAIMTEFGTSFGNRAGDAAYALREMVAEVSEVELPVVTYSYAPDPMYVENTARYQVGKFIEGDQATFVDRIADAARYFAERGANDTMHNVGKADAKAFGKRVRWARVPTGATTCPYCLMLASRGFVYRSEAKTLNANHRHCDCRIVEGFDDMEVEGYEQEEYYDRWKHPEIYAGLDSITTESFACLRVAEKHGQVVYEKPLLSFLEKDEDRRDLVAHAALARAGKRFTALAEDAPDGYSNIDLLMDGEKWEVKSPSGANVRAVESNLRKAKKQAAKNYPEPISDVRVVFNSCYYGRDDDWVSEELGYQMSEHGIFEVLHIGKDGRISSIEKAQTPSSERPGLH